MNLHGKLARGEKVPLAPMFLGTFYRCLDSIKLEMEHHVGQYDVTTFLMAFFLQVILYEQFPRFSPEHLTFSLTKKARRVGLDDVPFEDVF
ncbi:hypothetical protein U1Q18_003177 [Sarracenia purpurea var. burkii]